MYGLFTEEDSGAYRTTARNILIASRYFTENPIGTIPTGLWTEPTWHEHNFRFWFFGCLTAKINREDRRSGRKLTQEYQLALLLDCRMIRDYAHRVRHSGCRNLLRTPEMQSRYPGVNNQDRYE